MIYILPLNSSLMPKACLSIELSQMEEVKLLGIYHSPFSCRAILALKLKGIPYEYIEEDFSNKSPLLLQHNPVHKKIPVLVHGGKPICESLIILEYIEQTWPQNPLLPADPYDRALARFWVKFVEDKGPIIWTMFQTTGEEQENAMKDGLEMLKTLEKALGEKKFFGGEWIGIVDISLGVFAYWLGVFEDILGLKLLAAHSFPLLHAWIKKFMEVPVIKENLPDRDKLFVVFKRLKE
ncbi:probable glutathione S-transferase [Cornus florida]|uniref:probable glutathione S-transferase n=1 Tax=Cornus florida TaxID=4283 RepID=UPI0028A0505A|nr:probable glutathione S-transferase [Cornus florida]